MSKTLYYYNALITVNDQVTNIHLSDLLDRIRAVHVRRRLKYLKQGNICLMNMMDPETNINDESDRKLVVGKFRDFKPFLGTLGTDRIDEIPDDVVELTSLFYRRNSRLLIVEYNHFGVRPNALQYYLKSFMPVTDTEVWDIRLEPIEPQLGFADVSQSEDIKSIQFKIDLTARNNQIYRYQNEEDNNRSVLGNILTRSIETHNEFGANIATVGFGNGRRWRRGVIDPEDLVNTLRGLDLESDIFESIKIVYISPSTNRKEQLDLKNEGVLKEVLNLDMDENGWEYICDNIESNFYNNGRLGEANHMRYDIEIDSHLPQLLYNNTDEV